VILGVTLALMALLVATAGNPARAPRSPRAQSDDARRTPDPAAAGSITHASTTTSTAPSSHAPATSLLSSHVGVGTATPATATTTTTSVPPTTTTTTTAPAEAPASQPSDRTQSQGVIEPPQQRSSSFGFTGAGATEVSVVWSGATYLTMEVSCPNGSQNVGGSSAMAASLPDASGSCLATVSEPSTESTALTYTITIGPAGG
jgi:hypothetical protein